MQIDAHCKLRHYNSTLQKLQHYNIAIKASKDSAYRQVGIFNVLASFENLLSS